MTAQQRLFTAVHEAGHAAAGHLLLGAVEAVEVRPGTVTRGDRTFSTSGMCRPSRRSEPADHASGLDRVQRAAIVLAAGYAAEVILAGSRAARDVAAKVDDLDLDAIAAVALVEDGPNFRRWVDLEAEALVRDAADLIFLITQDLMSADEVSGDRVAFLAGELGLAPASRSFAHPAMMRCLNWWEPTDESTRRAA